MWGTITILSHYCHLGHCLSGAKVFRGTIESWLEKLSWWSGPGSEEKGELMAPVSGEDTCESKPFPYRVILNVTFL